MRFFVGGPKMFGLRTGVLFGPGDFFRRAERPQSAGRATYVYVIEGEHGAVKIGLTTCPSARLAHLRTGSPVDLRFSALATCSGGAYEVERRAHQILDAHRLSGEWFDVSPEEAMRAVSQAAAAAGQSLKAADPDQTTVPIQGRSQAEARRGKRNMLIVACALLAALLAAAAAVYLMISTNVSAQTLF